MKPEVPLLRIVPTVQDPLAPKRKPRKKNRVVKKLPLMHPVISNPNPIEAVVIYRAQSILTMDGQVGPLLPFAQAQDVVRWYDASPQYVPEETPFKFKWWF